MDLDKFKCICITAKLYIGRENVRINIIVVISHQYHAFFSALVLLEVIKNIVVIDMLNPLYINGYVGLMGFPNSSGTLLRL